MTATPEWDLNNPNEMSAQLDAWLADNWQQDITLREWWQRLADAGLTVPTWPKIFGGLNSTTVTQQLVEEALKRVGAVAPPLVDDGIRLVGPALRQHATPRQAERYVPSLVNGTEPWVLLFDESADDPMTDIQATATIEWNTSTLNGTKYCRSAIGHARWGLFLCRTDKTTTGTKGLSCFAVDLHHAGVSFPGPNSVAIRAIKVANDDNLIGAEGDGWSVVKTVLPYQQRSLAGRIRRGLVLAIGGERAGNLDRTVGALIESHRNLNANRPEPTVERRTQPG